MPDQRSVDAVVWDFGGVLISTIENKVSFLAERAGLPLETVVTLLLGPRHESTDYHPWHRAERGELETAAIQEELAPLAVQAGIELVGDEIDVLLDAETYTIHSHVFPAITEIRSRGYRTGLLTNCFREFRPTLERDIPLSMFDIVIDSSAEGVRKPQPEVYALTSERLGVDPTSIVFLDDFEGNIEGAKRAGWQTISVSDVDAAMRDLADLLTTAGRYG